MDLDGLMAKAEAVVILHDGTWANYDAHVIFTHAFTPEVAKALIRVAKAAKAWITMPVTFDDAMEKAHQRLEGAIAELESLP